MNRNRNINRNMNRNNNIKREKRSHDIILKDHLKNNKWKNIFISDNQNKLGITEYMLDDFINFCNYKIISISNNEYTINNGKYTLIMKIKQNKDNMIVVNYRLKKIKFITLDVIFKENENGILEIRHKYNILLFVLSFGFIEYMGNKFMKESSKTLTNFMNYIPSSS